VSPWQHENWACRMRASNIGMRASNIIHETRSRGALLASPWQHEDWEVKQHPTPGCFMYYSAHKPFCTSQAKRAALACPVLCLWCCRATCPNRAEVSAKSWCAHVVRSRHTVRRKQRESRQALPIRGVLAARKLSATESCCEPAGVHAAGRVARCPVLHALCRSVAAETRGVMLWGVLRGFSSHSRR